MALVLGFLTANPAVAAYAVESITFPAGVSEFYSPFSGPASIRFTFDGSENDATFNLRIRPQGGSVVHSENVLVDADDPNGFQIKTFNWPALSVNAPRTYVVAVYRNDVLVTSESFQLETASRDHHAERRRTPSCRGSTTDTRTRPGSRFTLARERRRC